MENRNRYCVRCQCTTRFDVKGTVYTCSRCGVVVDTALNHRERTLIGNPFRTFRKA